MKPTIDALMRTAPVIPVLVIEDVAHAVGIAQALVAGGLPVLEVTLRTEAALDVIRAMKTVPGAIVGAGTVLNPAMLDQALEAGSEFVVSPGLTVAYFGYATFALISFFFVRALIRETKGRELEDMAG